MTFLWAPPNPQVEAPEASTSWQDSISERPPYSYMALIQFAINSTERKRMTLKDIYSWIEDHFPYFKYIAKPGWKVPTSSQNRSSSPHLLSTHPLLPVCLPSCSILCLVPREVKNLPGMPKLD